MRGTAVQLRYTNTDLVEIMRKLYLTIDAVKRPPSAAVEMLAWRWDAVRPALQKPADSGGVQPPPHFPIL
jgi:hypothetical protein